MSKLKEAISIIKNDNSNKAIVTDYQFISVILSIYANSPNKFWYSFYVYPSKSDISFDFYQKFFIKQIAKKKIQTFYRYTKLIKEIEEHIINSRKENQDIIHKRSSKKLLIVGPCSTHNIDEALKNAQVVAFLTGHNEFKLIEITKLKNLLKPNAFIYDGRMYFSDKTIDEFKDANFIFKGVGRLEIKF